MYIHSDGRDYDARTRYLIYRELKIIVRIYMLEYVDRLRGRVSPISYPYNNLLLNLLVLQAPNRD